MKIIKRLNVKEVKVKRVNVKVKVKRRRSMRRSSLGGLKVRRFIKKRDVCLAGPVKT